MFETSATALCGTTGSNNGDGSVDDVLGWRRTPTSEQGHSGPTA